MNWKIITVKVNNMDEQLKFSWGHIIAFLALIFISYITFVGVVYRTDGDFTKAAVTMAVVDIVLVVVFIGSQMAKATAHKISKKFGWSELVFVLLLSYFSMYVAVFPFLDSP